MRIKYLLFIPTLLLVGCKSSEPTTYKVIYDANGGSFTSGTTIEVTVEANKPMEELVETPTHDKDYLFGNWYENKEGSGKSFDFSTNVTHNITLYARWLDNSGPDADFDGLGDSIDPAPNDNTYTSHLIEIYPPIHIVDMPITVDYRRFLKDENEFDKDLEELGNVCAMDIYKVSTTTLKGPSNIYEPIVGDDDDKLYLQLGCTDIEITTFNPNQYEIDKFDTYLAYWPTIALTTIIKFMKFYMLPIKVLILNQSGILISTQASIMKIMHILLVFPKDSTPTGLIMD